MSTPMSTSSMMLAAVPHYKMNTSSITTPGRTTSLARKYVIHPHASPVPVEGVPESPGAWASPPLLRSSTNSLASSSTNTIRNKQVSLKCLLCSEFYTDPLMLPCLHSYCRKCITELAAEEGRDTKCPTCGAGDVLPAEGGVHNLPKNLWLAHQVEINIYQEKLGSGHGDVPCDRCVKQSNGFADVFCCQCCQFLCRSCKEDHKWCRDTVNHELIEVGRARGRSLQVHQAMEQTVSVNLPSTTNR